MNEQIRSGHKFTWQVDNRRNIDTHMCSSFPLLIKNPSCFTDDLSTSKYSSCRIENKATYNIDLVIFKQRRWLSACIKYIDKIITRYRPVRYHQWKSLQYHIDHHREHCLDLHHHCYCFPEYKSNYHVSSNNTGGGISWDKITRFLSALNIPHKDAQSSE